MVATLLRLNICHLLKEAAIKVKKAETVLCSVAACLEKICSLVAGSLTKNL